MLRVLLFPHRKQDKMTFRGDRLKERREAINMTQDELADRVGVQQQTIHRYESGKSQPSATILTAMALALGGNSSYFLNETSYSGPLDEYAERALAAIRRGDKNGVANAAADKLRKMRKSH